MDVIHALHERRAAKHFDPNHKDAIGNKEASFGRSFTCAQRI